jgi:hypothetical protein
LQTLRVKAESLESGYAFYRAVWEFHPEFERDTVNGGCFVSITLARGQHVMAVFDALKGHVEERGQVSSISFRIDDRPYTVLHAS